MQKSNRNAVKTVVFIAILGLAASAFAQAPTAPAKAAPAKAAPAKAAPAKDTAKKKVTKSSAPDRPASPAATAGAASPADSAVPEAAPAPPAPGFVVITVDTEGLSAVVGGEVHGLKKGDNRFELPAGPATVDVQGKDGKSIKKAPLTIASAVDTALVVNLTGKLVVSGAALSVKVDGKPVEAKDGAVTTQLLRGKHSVVVSQPGRVGVKSDIEVMAGRTHTINPTLKSFNPGNKTTAWASVLGGGGLIIASVLLERFTDASSTGSEAARWVMVGGGIAGFAGGTIMMKNIYKAEANPPVQDGTLDVKVSQAERAATTRVAAAR
jgi:hypothetical protein